MEIWPRAGFLRDLILSAQSFNLGLQFFFRCHGSSDSTPGAHDDQLDAMTQALLTAMSFRSARFEASFECLETVPTVGPQGSYLNVSGPETEPFV
jgi:hypothetical protein